MVLMKLYVLTERLDILRYMHESFRRIDVDYCFRVAERNNKQEMIPSLLEMEWNINTKLKYGLLSQFTQQE